MCLIIQIGDAVDQSLQDLELRRKDLFRQLENLGDFRRGTISVNYRKCGKSNCACARKGHPGHGPQYLWNVSIGGKTQARNLPLGPELEKLEKLLNSDGGGYRGAHLDCGHGHPAEFVEYRGKQILTVLSSVEVQRAYYHCSGCQGGLVPKDQELDVVGSSFSPGVRRMMGRVGAKQPFEQGRGDLEELAGVVVQTKQVERISAQLGVQVEAFCQRERAAILSGKVTPLLPAVPILYIAIDGTGVPVVPRETEGRRGKDATGKAKTREAKIGCVFTQTKQDEEGYPIRDEDSTTYVGAIETAEAFGPRIYAEAVRRGLRQAQKVVVLGDGGPWIWGIAAQYFPWATEIVDLYHAREHLANLGKIVYGPASAQAKQWAAARSEQDRKSTRLNSSHTVISYAVFCLKKKKNKNK